MYMIRGTADPARLRELIRSRAVVQDYARHQLVWRLLRVSEEDPTRRILYRWETDGLPRFFAVTDREPPHDPDSEFVLETKPYAISLSPGDRLTFSLRANPVVKKRDENGRQTRHDVVMDLKRRIRAGEAEEPDDIIREAGLTWLRARAEKCGFDFDAEEVIVSGHRQLALRKRSHKNLISLSILEFDGLLRVTDPDAFSNVLYHGLGTAKGFGCGLVLVQRA